MSLPRKSALCQSAELHISIIIIFTSSAHYTRDPRRMLLKQRLNLQTGTTVLRDRKPVCSSSDSHGKPVPKKRRMAWCILGYPRMAWEMVTPWEISFWTQRSHLLPAQRGGS